MAGCLKALHFWRKKSRPYSAGTNERSSSPQRGRTRTVWIPDPEKPPLDVQHVNFTLPSTGVPIRRHVNPSYSAAATPADTRWIDSATATKAAPAYFGSGVRMQDGDIGDPDEVARQKKAAQEEQERLDFFQMM
ncbi:hypothetical protein N657DRAFT_684896 [Parathielavia appendiculata]|uniref:Uncharacterized protein n=1 Tax=Parathielavia appendiculata TaxID=2587402 RepID=A0AAN6YZ29_9PEZI|nr:hypothetical protein N657DRAFT_684896 [Parathielavia appendiculata]